MVHTDFPRGVGYISVDGNQCRANGYLGVDVLSRETNPNLDKRMKPDWIDHSVDYARMCWSVETRLMMLPLLKKKYFFSSSDRTKIHRAYRVNKIGGHHHEDITDEFCRESRVQSAGMLRLSSFAPI